MSNNEDGHNSSNTDFDVIRGISKYLFVSNVWMKLLNGISFICNVLTGLDFKSLNIIKTSNLDDEVSTWIFSIVFSFSKSLNKSLKWKINFFDYKKLMITWFRYKCTFNSFFKL